MTHEDVTRFNAIIDYLTLDGALSDDDLEFLSDVELFLRTQVEGI